MLFQDRGTCPNSADQAFGDVTSSHGLQKVVYHSRPCAFGDPASDPPIHENLDVAFAERHEQQEPGFFGRSVMNQGGELQLGQLARMGVLDGRRNQEEPQRRPVEDRSCEDEKARLDGKQDMDTQGWEEKRGDASGKKTEDCPPEQWIGGVCVAHFRDDQGELRTCQSLCLRHGGLDASSLFG